MQGWSWCRRMFKSPMASSPEALHDEGAGADQL